MRNRFDIQLENLNNDMIAMGALCENAISSAVKGLLTYNVDIAREAIAVEKEIDQKERDIEALCLKLLLQQQPVARDLRLISAALKMITDMERIGDQAADIAEIVTFADLSRSTSSIHIAEMADAAIKMVTDSINAFVARDIQLAEAVIAYDDVVDNLFTQIKKDIVSLIASDTVTGEAAIDVLMIAKYLERIGDHAVNIAEWVEFSITGTHKG
ncbi:MAG: phosphate signaling complex protein PhoU [Spirochaetaceae bacterium]|jgi:phosphate transport system protein|nr:phosphate signaling complex protein PhoU [Spirochaetaceae bacterium]